MADLAGIRFSFSLPAVSPYCFLPLSVARLPVPVKAGRRRHAPRSGAAGVAVARWRGIGPCVPVAGLVVRPVDVYRAARAAIVRMGMPGRDMAAAVNAADDVNGSSRGGIGVNGPSTWTVAPDGEPGGVVVDGDSCSGRGREAAAHMKAGMGFPGRKRHQSEQGACGTVGKEVVFNGCVFHKAVSGMAGVFSFKAEIPAAFV